MYHAWGRVPNLSFACGYLIVPAQFTEESILFPLNGLDTLVKNQLTKDVWIYSGLCFFPLMYITILTPVPHCFNNYSFVVSFEIEKHESSNSVSFSRLFCLLWVYSFLPQSKVHTHTHTHICVHTHICDHKLQSVSHGSLLMFYVSSMSNIITW